MGKLELALTSILAACAILVTALVVRREFFASSNPSGPVEIEDWERLAKGGLVMGAVDASTQLVVFTDFQCPYCKELSVSYDSLLREFPGDLKVVLRHYPISGIHPFAFQLAVGAECAARVDKLTEYHEVVFRNQDSLPGLKMGEIAASSGVVDTTSFMSCMQESRPTEKVRQDSALGVEVGLTGTPLVILNNLKFSGTPDLASLRGHVKKLVP